MNVAEILSAIVERACLYVPEAPVGATNIKRPKALTKFEKFPKEALIKEVVPNEERTSVEQKFIGVSSDLVIFK